MSLGKGVPVSSPKPAREVFVGRERELELLTALIDEEGADIRSVLISGEAGIGKTSLVEKLVETARQRGMSVLLGRCYQELQAAPYFPFHQILSELSVASQSSREFLEGLARGFIRENEWSSHANEAQAGRARFLTSVSRALVSFAQTTHVLLCVEDLQWADTGSLLLLNSLLDLRGANLVIVCSTRAKDPTAPDTRQLVGRIEQRSQRIELRGLNTREARDLIVSLAGAVNVVPSEIEDLRSITSGNPMFLRELWLYLRDSRLLETYTVPDAIRRMHLPEKLSQLIDLRLRSLSSRERKTLMPCSLLGMQFSADLVGSVTGDDLGTVLGELEGGVAKGILKPIDRLGGPSYAFAHPLVRARLEELLPPKSRRRIHSQVVKAATSGDVPLSIGELARHYALGFGTTTGSKAIDCCRAAAEQAERVLAYESAAQYWEYALRCTEPRQRRIRAELCRRLGWTYSAAGNWTKASEAWIESVRLFESLGTWKPVGELALALGELHRFRQELDLSGRWLERALELLPETTSDRARALALLGSIRCLDGDPRLGLELLKEASHVVGDEYGDPYVAYWLAFGFYTTGDFARALDVAKKGLEIAKLRGSSRAVSLLAGNLVLYELNSLRASSAWSYSRLAKEAADPNDTPTVVRYFVCQAWLLGYAGRWSEVQQLCDQWMAEVRLAGRFQVGTARFIRAEASLALGDATLAEREMQIALPFLKEMQPTAPLHLARVLANRRKTSEAASIVRRYAASVMEGQRYGAARAVLGDIVSRLELRDLWLPCYDALKNEQRPVMILYSPISVQRVLGGLAARLKRWSAAVEHFETALDQLGAGSAYWELAQTYLDYGDMRRQRRRRGDLRKAAAMEAEADGILKKLGIERPQSSHDRESPADSNRFGLTSRELEVLAMVAEGLRNQEIATALTLSRGTVNRHLENIFVKMGVDNRTEAVVKVVQERLLEPRAGGSPTARPTSLSDQGRPHDG